MMIMLFNIPTKIIAINSQDKIIKFSSFKCTLHKSMIKNRGAFSNSRFLVQPLINKDGAYLRAMLITQALLLTCFNQAYKLNSKKKKKKKKINVLVILFLIRHLTGSIGFFKQNVGVVEPAMFTCITKK